MRQINFVVIFVICLALVLFGIQNTELVSIQVIEGLEVQAPLSVELIIAMGIGAVLAWIFSVWAQVQKLLSSRQQVQARDVRIRSLEQDIERYKAEVEEQRLLLPSANPSVE